MLLVQLELLVMSGLLVRWVQLVLLEQQERRVLLELLGQRGLREPLELELLRAQLELQVPLELEPHLEPQEQLLLLML